MLFADMPEPLCTQLETIASLVASGVACEAVRTHVPRDRFFSHPTIHVRSPILPGKLALPASFINVTTHIIAHETT